MSAIDWPSLGALEDSPEDLWEHAPCGFLSTLADGTIVKVNRTFLAWTGYSDADLIGRLRFQDLLTAGGRIYHETHYAPLLLVEGKVQELALELVCAGGERLAVLVNSVMKRAPESGQPAVIRTTVFDATHRREYERALLRARQRAEASEARARLLSQTLQNSLIPPAPPLIPGLDVAGAYRPAGTGEEVGGDFYDVFETGRGGWAVVLGDVCGKGAEAAAVTALARYTIRAAAMRSRRPRQVLAALNQALLLAHADRFCTVVYAAVGRSRGRTRLTVSSAGHPLPIRVGPAHPPAVVGRPGSLLGVLDAPDLADTSVELAPGDAVVFYTDGVAEGRAGNAFYGDERLLRLVGGLHAQPAAAITRAVVDDVVAFQGGSPRDDIAVVALKVPDEREGPSSP